MVLPPKTRRSSRLHSSRGARSTKSSCASLSRGGQIRTAIVRPGIVYGGARGIISDLLKNAKNGLLRVVGDGSNHWPCVYDRDLADLYVRLAAHPEASGIFHANDEADERVSDIVEAIARHVMVQQDVRHVPIEEARAKMGQYADALALDQIVRSPRARALGWTPTLHSVAGNVAGLIEEFRSGQEAARLGIVEVALVFLGHARQKIKKRIEASVERTTQLRNRAVDRVQSQAGGSHRHSA